MTSRRLLSLCSYVGRRLGPTETIQDITRTSRFSMFITSESTWGRGYHGPCPVGAKPIGGPHQGLADAAVLPWGWLSIWGSAAALIGAGFLSERPLTSLAEARLPQQADLSPPPDPYTLPAGPVALPKTVIVYQYEVCPFCCKLKAFLDFYKIPYQTVEVNPIFKSQLKWSTYKKVPVVLMDGQPMTDSSAIISYLAAAVCPQKQEDVRPQRTWWGRTKQAEVAEQGVDEEQTWREWVDQRLVKVVTVNIYRTARESFQTFDYITENGNFNMLEREAARIFGAVTMYGISGKLKRKYGIEGEAREELYKTAAEWESGLKGRPFMGGDKPNLADISAFGVIRSITGTDTFLDLLHNTGISGWYERMMGLVGESSRIEAH